PEPADSEGPEDGSRRGSQIESDLPKALLSQIRIKSPTRRQSQRPQPSCLVLTKAESNEPIDYTIEACTSHAGCGRGSSLTLGKKKRLQKDVLRISLSHASRSRKRRGRPLDSRSSCAPRSDGIRHDQARSG